MNDSFLPLSDVRKLSVICQKPIQLSTCGGDYLVPCGHCDACLNASVAKSVTLIKRWASQYKYQYFSTLTYSPEALPVMDYRIDMNDVFKDKDGHVYYNTTFVPRPRDLSMFKRSSRGRQFVAYDDTFESYVNRDLLLQFSKLQGDLKNSVYYAPSFDYQRFIKRLRQQISLEFRLQPAKADFGGKTQKKEILSSKDLSFSYYVVSEYGERTCRPHWHLILCFNSEFLHRNIVRLIDECWRLGYTNTSMSRGHDASYIASYLSCASDFGDLFRQCPSLRPVRRHSQKLYEAYFPEHCSLEDFEKYATLARRGKVVKDDGVYTREFPTLSNFDRLFLRLPVDGTKYDYAYLRLPFALSRFPVSTTGNDIFNFSVTPTDYACFCVNSWIKTIARFLNEYRHANDIVTPQALYNCGVLSEYVLDFMKVLGIDSWLVGLARMSISNPEFFGCYVINSPMYSLVVGRMVVFLTRLRRVLSTWNIRSFNTLCDYTKLLVKFYKDKNYDSLIHFYSRLEGFANPNVTSMLYHLQMYYYGNEKQDSFDYSSNPAFHRAAAFSKEMISRKKHSKKISHILNKLV